MLEISFVPIPALPSALIDAQARGIQLRPLGDWASRTLDVGKFRGLERPTLEGIYRACSGRTFHAVPATTAERQERADAHRARIRAEDAAATDEVRRRLLRRLP